LPTSIDEPTQTSDFVSHHLTDAPSGRFGLNLRKSNSAAPQGHSFAPTRYMTTPIGGSGLIEAAQHRWRAVNAPHLVALVRAGAKFERGKLIERETPRTPGEATKAA